MEVNNVKGWWALKPAEWDHGNKYCQPIKEWPKLWKSELLYDILKNQIKDSYH